MNLTPLPGRIVTTPLIKECPINLECRVRQTLRLGSHEMFIAEIVMVHADENLLDDKFRPDIDLLKPLTYCTVAREYRGGLVKIMGRYGGVAGKK